jgi:hypothetical protein
MIDNGFISALKYYFFVSRLSKELGRPSIMS